MRVIGLDVGEKRIGVAKADSSTRIAVPVGFVAVDGSEWQEIAKIARLNSTNFFVVGLPRSNEGKETAQSLYVRKFVKALTENIPGAKVRLQDESLTSVVAEERLKASGRQYQRGDIDAEAAAVILQDFLEGLQAGASFPAEQPDETNLNAKKAKHKMKKATKWISGIAIVVILGLIGTGVALIIKENRHQEYLAWVAEQEAKMQADVFDFTILPGETIFDVRASLIEVGYTPTEVDQALDKSYDFAFLQGRPEGATLEGYLFGETHQFYESASAEEVIETFLKGTGEMISENNLEARYAEQGLSLYEGITLASMIQKEAPTSDMAGVAQVFLARLNYGMLLGSDVTASYAADKVDPDRQAYTDNAAVLDIDSCYNTRKYAGLPCGPISNPGREALLAVADPADTSYLYFLTGDDGLMYYSYTEDEHLQNAAEHCPTLCNVSL